MTLRERNLSKYFKIKLRGKNMKNEKITNFYEILKEYCIYIGFLIKRKSMIIKMVNDYLKGKLSNDELDNLINFINDATTQEQLNSLLELIEELSETFKKIKLKNKNIQALTEKSTSTEKKQTSKQKGRS